MANNLSVCKSLISKAVFARAIPFMVMSAGMVMVWAFLRVREPVKMET